MTHQNRVLPTGEIITHPARGSFMGNRGILHDTNGRLGAARWRHKTWITCVLHFKDRHRRVMSPNSYTELFFPDEAVALAAGHRPCAECRRADYNRFLECWQMAFGHRPRARDIDETLHQARINPRTRRQMTYDARADTLPSGVFIRRLDQPYLVCGDNILPFVIDSYGQAQPRPAGEVEVLTPRPTVATMQAGYSPLCIRS